MIKNVYWVSCKITVILVPFVMKLEFSRRIFEKYSKIKINGNPSPGGGGVVPCVQTDGRT